MITVLSILFIMICIFLVLMVVITPSQEGGMAAAFGGAGSESFFGTKAHQHISKFTVFLAVSFLLLAIVINKYNATHPPGGQQSIKKAIQEVPTPPPAQP